MDNKAVRGFGVSLLRSFRSKIHHNVHDGAFKLKILKSWINGLCEAHCGFNVTPPLGIVMKMEISVL